jgi:hypothetical protein
MRQRLYRQSRTSPTTLRRASAISVIALLCAVGLFIATPASAARWIGTVQGTSTKTTKLASGGFSWQGSFWFHVRKSGAVDGFGMVGYQPSLNLTLLNNALTYVRDVSTDFVNLLPPPWGPIVNAAGPRQIIGTYVEFRDSMGVRAGPISGRKKGNKLTLKWDLPPDSLRYEIYVRFVGGSQRIGSSNAPLPDPFASSESGKPLVGHIASRGQAWTVNPEGPSPSGPRVSSYWVAHKVN